MFIIRDPENKTVQAAYVNGTLFDAPRGIGSIIKEYGLNPARVLLTAQDDDRVAGLAEIEGVPVYGFDKEVPSDITRFNVGFKGSKRCGYRFDTPDGKFVYAPVFDRVEKSKLANADVAVVDAGIRKAVDKLAGVPHKYHVAREKMLDNAAVKTRIWTDEPAENETNNLGANLHETKAVDYIALDTEVRSAFAETEFDPPISQHRFVARVTDEYIIVSFYEVEESDEYYHVEDEKIYQIPYTREASGITFAPLSEWVEVVGEYSYSPVEKSTFSIARDETTGVVTWMSISSSTFKDTDGEVVSAEAMDFAIALGKHRGDLGNLVWEHYDELPIGKCTSQTRVGRFLVEQGYFYDTPIGRAAAKKLKAADPGKYRVSIGFRYWKGTRSDDGVFALIDIFHRATTTRPANPFTSIEVKSMKTLTEDIKKGIAADLGMSIEELEGVIAVAEQAQAPLAGVKTALKEEAEPAAPETPAAPVAEVEVVASETPEASPEVPAVAEVDRVAELMGQIKELQDALIAVKADSISRADLAAMLNTVSKDQVTRASVSGTELPEKDAQHILETQTKMAEKQAANPGNRDVTFQDIYAMFGPNRA